MGLLVDPAGASMSPSILGNGAASGTANGVKHADSAVEAPKRMHCTYNDLHKAIVESLPKLQEAGFGTPDYLIAIAGGGLIPARILRSALRSQSKKGGCAAIKVVGLELYDEEFDGRPHERGVVRTQWLEPEATQLVGKTVLLVDEVDDSRQTLEYAVRELQADIAAQEAALAAAGAEVRATRLGVFVIHNKQRPKVGSLPEGVPEFVAQEVAGAPWIVYPWDMAEPWAVADSSPV